MSYSSRLTRKELGIQKRLPRMTRAAFFVSSRKVSGGFAAFQSFNAETAKRETFQPTLLAFIILPLGVTHVA